MTSNTRGLRYETVKDVADRLVAQGKSVARITYRDILAETGTGSLETIGIHLRRYRLDYVETVSEDEVDPAELDDFLDPVRQIVSRKVRKVNERRDLELAGIREQVQTCTENLTFAVARNKELEEELAQVNDANRALKEDAATATSRVAKLQGKLDEARDRYEDLVTRLLHTAVETKASASATADAETIPPAPSADLFGSDQPDHVSGKDIDGSTSAAE